MSGRKFPLCLAPSPPFRVYHEGRRAGKTMLRLQRTLTGILLGIFCASCSASVAPAASQVTVFSLPSVTLSTSSSSLQFLQPPVGFAGLTVIGLPAASRVRTEGMEQLHLTHTLGSNVQSLLCPTTGAVSRPPTVGAVCRAIAGTPVLRATAGVTAPSSTAAVTVR